jgi:hypothetical protein
MIHPIFHYVSFWQIKEPLKGGKKQFEPEILHKRLWQVAITVKELSIYSSLNFPVWQKFNC